MNLVIDASIAIQYLLRTQTGQHAAGMIDHAELAAPELLDAEVLAVLRDEVITGRLDEARAAEAVYDLSRWGVERLAHRPLLAVAWRLRPNVTACDALYVAAARARGAALLTADGPRVPPPAFVLRTINGVGSQPPVKSTSGFSVTSSLKPLGSDDAASCRDRRGAHGAELGQPKGARLAPPVRSTRRHPS